MIDDLMYHEMPCIAKEIRCFYDFFDYFLLSHRESTYYERIKIVLIGGEALAELMIDHNVGVSTIATYDLKKIDSDYFTEE
jgi:hypothetical protein